FMQPPRQGCGPRGGLEDASGMKVTSALRDLFGVGAEDQRHHQPLVARRHRARKSQFLVFHRNGLLRSRVFLGVVLAMTDFTVEREKMVERQLEARGIVEKPILDAFRAVPREAFIGSNNAHLASGDHPLPIEAGQTISQPYIVALMIQAAQIGPEDKVLEVGAGSGYATAVISAHAHK